jgi:hypothetical protein
MPIAQMLEAEANAKLLGRNQFSTQYTKIDLRGLMRGDQKQRNDSYAVAKQWGWISTNEIRALEDLDPIGPEGDVYLVPANMTTVGRIINPPEPSAPQSLPAPREPEEIEDRVTAVVMRLVPHIVAGLRPEMPDLVIQNQQPSVTVLPQNVTIHAPIASPEVKVTQGDTFLTVPPAQVKVDNVVQAPSVDVHVPERSVYFQGGDTHVSVPEREVRIENRAGDVHVAAPEVSVAPAHVTVEPALVNVNAPVAAADLSPIARLVQNALMRNEMPSITVNVPEQPPPVVNITNNLELPPRVTDSMIEYDAEGNIIGVTQQDRTA